MNAWEHQWMGGWMDIYMDGQLHEWMYGCMNVQMDGWMNGCQMDGCMSLYIDRSIFP